MQTFLPPKKILLIEPPFYRFFNYKRWFYPTTLTLVGSYLENFGHFVRIYDADRPSSNCRALSRIETRNSYYLYDKALENEGHHIWNEVSDTIKEFNPDIIGLTSITPKIDSTNKVAKIAREILGKKVKIILGGPHVQGMKTMYADYNFGDVYDEIVPHIPNLIDQKPNKKLLMEIEKYTPQNLASILTSTGCSNSCTFCCHSYERKIIYRNIPSFHQELLEEKQRSKGLAPIIIMDDCILSNTSRFNEICDIFKRLELKFIVCAKIMALTPEKILKFINSGGIHLSVGIESGSQRTLDRIKKNLKIDEVIRRTKWLNEAGLSWSSFIIIGFPFEDINDLKATEKIILTTKPTYASINRFSPYPGTEIYKEYFLNANIRFRDIFQLNGNSRVKLSAKMEKYIDYLYETFDTYNKKNSKKNNFIKHMDEG